MTAAHKPWRRVQATTRNLQKTQRYFWAAENKDSTDPEIKAIAKRLLKGRLP